MKFIKGFVVLLFFLILGVGLYLYLTKKTAPAPSQTNTTPSPSQSAGEVVTLFYKKYQDCMKNPPLEAEGNVDIYCQSHTDLTTPAFLNNLDQGGTAKAGANPIVCAQNIPETVQIGSISSNNGTSQVVVTETFGPTKLEVPVLLKLENNQWRVDNIVCPRPSP